MNSSSTQTNMPPMFGPSSVVDPATYEPRSGKSTLVNKLIAELAGKPEALAATIIGNSTTRIFQPTRLGMSYLPLALTDTEVASFKVRDE